MDNDKELFLLQCMQCWPAINQQNPLLLKMPTANFRPKKKNACKLSIYRALKR